MILDKHPLLDAADASLSYSGEGSYPARDGYGFFIQDHLSVLNLFGEWHYNVPSQDMFVYTGDKAASEFKIETSAIEHLLTNADDVEHVVVENLRFVGANKSAVVVNNAKAIQLLNCTIQYSGENGVLGIGADNITVSGSTILHSQNNGIFIDHSSTSANILDNIVQSTYLFPGMGLSGDGNGFGIYVLAEESDISNNKVIETGYTGIGFNGNKTIVKNNYIHSFCLVKNDGGGIYTYEGPSNRDYVGRKILHNIIVNGQGTWEGVHASKSFPPQVEGIYLDDNANGIEVMGNTIADVSRNGIHVHNGRNITIQNNTVLGGYRQLFLSHDLLGERIRDIAVFNNIFLAGAEAEILVGLSSIADDFEEMAAFKDNLYVRPISKGYGFQVMGQAGAEPINATWYSFEQWSGMVGEEGSTDMPLEGYEVSAQDPQLTYSFGGESSPLQCLDDDCEVKITDNGPSDKITVVDTKENKSGVKLEVGAIAPDADYLLQVPIHSRQNLIARVALRHSGPPWSFLTDQYVFAISPGDNLLKVPFIAPDPSEKAVVVLSFQGTADGLGVSPMGWYKTKIDVAAPSLQLKYNARNGAVEIETEAGYKCIGGEMVSNLLLLPPFSSCILYRAD